MKIVKEKRNRGRVIKDKISTVVGLMVKSLGYIESQPAFGVKSARAVCHETGRARGVIKGYRVSRYIYRVLSDGGQIEGVRRGT